MRTETERTIIDYSDTLEEEEISHFSNSQKGNPMELDSQASYPPSSTSSEKKRKNEELDDYSNSPSKKSRSDYDHEERGRSRKSDSRERSRHYSSYHSDKYSKYNFYSRSRSRERSHSKDRNNRNSSHYSSSSSKGRQSSREKSREPISKDKQDEKPKEKLEAKVKEFVFSHEVLSSSNSIFNSNSNNYKIKENENSLKESPSEVDTTPEIIYQKKVEEALKNMQEESEEEKIRKARERRRVIMMKYSQQQPEKEQAPLPQQNSDNQEKAKEEGIFSPNEPTNPLFPVSLSCITSEKNGQDTVKRTTSPSSSPPSSPFRLEQPLFDEISNTGDQGVEPEMQDENLANEKFKALNPSFGTINVTNVNTNISLPQKSKDKEDFDMFSDSPALSPISLPKIPTKSVINTESVDDSEGYYCYRVGEVLNGRFLLLGSYGKGVFSTVIRSTDQQTGKEVAVKILRNNDAMKRMGLKEIELLKQISETDPEGKYNCVKLIHHFEDRNHLCLVFEALGGGNLREVLRKYGHKIGLKIQAVKVYGHKLMLALKLLRKLKYFHADLKPDNILANETKTSVKLADFGSASPVADNPITPFLVSRWYRAPEIMLGLPYSYEIDMWSLGCTLFEIATGKVLFPGQSNNEMLYLIMEVSGPVPKKMIKKGAFAAENFDENGNFKRYMVDKITTKEYIKVCQITQSTRDLKGELLNSPYQLSEDEKKMLINLHDLLMKIFVFDPSRRISVNDALRHPFFAK